MKNKIPIATFIIWGAVIAVVIAVSTVCIIFFVQGKWRLTTVDKSHYITVKNQSVEEAVTTISLKWVSGDVQINKSEDNRIHIIQKGQADFPDNQLFDAKVNGTTLVITDARGYGINFFGFGKHQDTDLELYLPETQYQHVTGEFTSADVTVDACQIADLELKTVSGKLDVNKGTYGNISLTSTSGDLFVGNVMVTQELNATSTSGNIKSEQSNVQGKLYCYSTSGEINMTQLKAPALTCESISSSIQVQGSLDHVTLGTTSGLLNVQSNKPLSQLTVHSISGSFHGILPENNGFTVTYSTISGTFESDFPTVNTDNQYVYGNGSGNFHFNSTNGNVSLTKAE